MKIFRKIRKSLLIKNKIQKYIVYSIGEIILIIIGILIALTVNNNIEVEKIDESTEAILEEILTELSIDIRKTTNLMKFYERKDSLIYLMKNYPIKSELFLNPELFDLYALTINYKVIHLTQESYDKLKYNIAEIPMKYHGVINELSYLYSIHS